MRSFTGVRRVQFLAANALLLGGAADALAATGAEGHGVPGVTTLLYPFLNFLLFIAVLVYAYKRAGKAKLVEQHTDVKEYLNRAAAELATAESAYAAAQRRLAEIEQEKAELVAALNREGEQLAAAAIVKAERSADNSRQDASRRIANEIARAEAELRREVVRRAAAQARQLVVARLSGEDDARLRREALQRIA